MPSVDLSRKIADVHESILGNAENGPWRRILDPALRDFVGRYVADAMLHVAKALDTLTPADVAELRTRRADGPLPMGPWPGVRERLARHLWVEAGHDPGMFDDIPAAIESLAAAGLKLAEADAYNDCYRRADQLLAIITGRDT